MLNETLIILKDHGPDAKVYYPDWGHDKEFRRTNTEPIDQNWHNSQSKIISILIKNIFLRLIKKVYDGALPSDETLKTLKIVSDLGVDDVKCSGKVKKIVSILEKIISKNDLEHDIDDINEVISSLKFFAMTLDTVGGE